MKLKNIEVNFSFTDADDLERFEKSAKKVKEESSKYNKQYWNVSEAIKKECEIIDNFFDEVFGEGISEKLFNNKKDLKEHIALFADIVNEKVEQTNRETRRYNQYKKGRR